MTFPMTMTGGFLVMVALDHYIFALLFLSIYLSSISLFFPCLISAAVGWMSTILWHAVALVRI